MWIWPKGTLHTLQWLKAKTKGEKETASLSNQTFKAFTDKYFRSQEAVLRGKKEDLFDPFVTSN